MRGTLQLRLAIIPILLFGSTNINTAFLGFIKECLIKTFSHFLSSKMTLLRDALRLIIAIVPASLLVIPPNILPFLLLIRHLIYLVAMMIKIFLLRIMAINPTKMVVTGAFRLPTQVVPISKCLQYDLLVRQCLHQTSPAFPLRLLRHYCYLQPQHLHSLTFVVRFYP